LLHRSLAVVGETAYTIYSILEITAAVYFPVIIHYRVAQKSKPLPNYQKLVLNRIKVRAVRRRRRAAAADILLTPPRRS